MDNFLLSDSDLVSFTQQHGSPVVSFAFDLSFCIHVDARIWEINISDVIAICRLIPVPVSSLVGVWVRVKM